MKIHYKHIAHFVTLAIVLSACGRISREHDKSSNSDTTEKSPTKVAESGKPAKWTMPEAMMQHMRQLEIDVRTLESSALKDHTALAVKLDEHTTQLISSCTMDGKAHDALHDWLMPFLQLNKDYAGATDAETKLAKFNEIKGSLAVFHKSFQ